MTRLLVTQRLGWHIPYWIIIAGLSTAYFLKQAPPNFEDLNFCMETAESALQAAYRDLYLENEACISGYRSPESEKWKQRWKNITLCFGQLDPSLDYSDNNNWSPLDPAGALSKNQPERSTNSFHNLFPTTAKRLEPYFISDPETWATLQRLLAIDTMSMRFPKQSNPAINLYTNSLKMKYILARWICQQYIMRHFGCCDMALDDRQLILIPQSNCPKTGEPYAIEVFLAQTGLKGVDLRFYANDMYLQPRFNGAIYTFKPQKPGKQSIRFRANLQDPATGTQRTWIQEAEIDVE